MSDVLNLAKDRWQVIRVTHVVSTFRHPVCIENSILIDYVTESPNVSDDDRSVSPEGGATINPLFRLPVLPENHIRT
jgi:hypothetical protein